MAVKYTDEQVAELRLRDTHNLVTVKAFATKHDISSRSVIAKVKSLGLAYVTKAGTKTQELPVVEGMDLGLTKDQCVQRIQKHLNLALPSLNKMNVTDLREMADRVQRALKQEVNYA